MIKKAMRVRQGVKAQSTFGETAPRKPSVRKLKEQAQIERCLHCTRDPRFCKWDCIG